MQKKIRDIAVVRSGAYIIEGASEEVCYLQVNDFNKAENRFVLPKPTLELNTQTKKHLLLEGDIVLAAKGVYNFCSVFNERTNKTVASSSFLVISIMNSSIINPDYLCWVLNREDTLAFLKANAVGSVIPSISKALVEAYEISIPPLQVQKKIVEISLLQQQEQQLYRRISKLRNQLTQRQLIKIIKSYGE
jgi:restriction endonuclease S subunit